MRSILKLNLHLRQLRCESVKTGHVRLPTRDKWGVELLAGEKLRHTLRGLPSTSEASEITQAR